MREEEEERWRKELFFFFACLPLPSSPSSIVAPELSLHHPQVQKAADLCPKFIGRDAKLWEKCLFRFAKMGQLKARCLISLSLSLSHTHTHTQHTHNTHTHTPRSLSLSRSWCLSLFLPPRLHASFFSLSLSLSFQVVCYPTLFVSSSYPSSVYLCCHQFLRLALSHGSLLYLFLTLS